MSDVFDYGLDRLRLSYSSRKTLKGCARRFEFSKMFRHPARDEGVHARVGTAIHMGYQEWLQSQDRDAAMWQMLLHYPYELVTNMSTYDRNIWACYATLNAIIDSAQLYDYEIAHIRGKNGALIPAIEVPFELHIKNFSASSHRDIPVSFIGKIDTLMFNRASDSYKAVDIKTHRKTLSDMTAVYAYDEQCIPYGLVLEHALNNPITSFEIMYISAFVDIADPTVRIYPFMKGPDEIQDWAKGFAIDLQLLRNYVDSAWFPRNAESCYSWNRRCLYFDECSSRDPDVVRKMIETGYEELKHNQEDHFGKPLIEIELDLGF